MPNKLLLPENFAAYNFVSLAKKEPHPQNRLRLIAMGHLQDGNTLKVAASYIKGNYSANFRQIILCAIKSIIKIPMPYYRH